MRSREEIEAQIDWIMERRGNVRVTLRQGVWLSALRWMLDPERPGPREESEQRQRVGYAS